MKGKEQGTVKNPSSSFRTDAVSLRSSGTTMLSSGFKLGQLYHMFVSRMIFSFVLFVRVFKPEDGTWISAASWWTQLCNMPLCKKKIDV